MADERVFELLRQAAEWRLIGLLLACPQGDWHEQVAALALEVLTNNWSQPRRPRRRSVGRRLPHTFGPGGPAAPREVSHRDYITPDNRCQS